MECSESTNRIGIRSLLFSPQVFLNLDVVHLRQELLNETLVHILRHVLQPGRRRAAATLADTVVADQDTCGQDGSARQNPDQHLRYHSPPWG